MRTRAIMTAIWFLGMCICTAFLLIFWALGVILAADVKELGPAILGLFLPFFAPIATYWYAERQHAAKAPRVASTLAVSLSMGYCILMTLILGAVFVATPSEGLVAQQVDVMRTLAVPLGGVVGGAIGFFFSQDN